jgi:FtsZ-binding cell division protein ZapB
MTEKLTERDYEVLDACYELLSIKIDELKAENDRLNKTLQEIKEIAEKELSYDMVGNEHRHYRNYDIIRHLITKAEEE